MTPFPIMVGCGRSGTTLLRSMVGAHPELAVPPEAHFVLPAIDATPPGEPFDLDFFVGAVTAHERFGPWEIEPAELTAFLRDRDVANGADAIRGVFACWADRQGKPRYADKTPMHILEIDRLAELFPEAVFVQLLRDGRDVACSFLDLGWSATLEEAALHWKLRVERGRRAAAALPPERYLELHYEQLVSDPETELRRLCAAVDLPFAAAMLDPSADAHEVIRTTAHPDYHRHLTKPPTPGLRDWRQVLTAAEVARFEVLAGDTLVATGYERAAASPSPRARIGAAVRLTRWQVHRVRKRIGSALGRE